jgi:hypothetical protein
MIDDTLNRFKVLRGSQLPHAKLNETQVITIRNAVAYREQLKAELATMTNAKLAAQYGVHVRTIDRVTAGDGWAHVCAVTDRH